MTCRAASALEQPTLANGSPEESPGFPTALTVTAIVLHGNRSKAAEMSWAFASFLACVCSFQVLVGPSFPRGFAGPWGAAGALCWGAARPSAPHGHPQTGQEHPLLHEPASALTLTPAEGQARPGFLAEPQEERKASGSPLPADMHHPRNRAGCSPACSQVPNLPRLNEEEVTIKKHQQM